MKPIALNLEEIENYQIKWHVKNTASTLSERRSVSTDIASSKLPQMIPRFGYHNRLHNSRNS
jgi:hypothetical protein